MFAVINPSLAILRSIINFSEICGEEYEIDYGSGGLRLPKDHCDLPVGSQIYYLSSVVQQRQHSYTQGVIIKVHYDRKSYDIQASNGLVDLDVPCNSVGFSVKPLVPFVSLESRREGGRLGAALTVREAQVDVGSATSCNTSHLFRLLRCSLNWAKKWDDVEIVSHEDLTMGMFVDLSMLCGQLVWLLVVNIAHHSCCVTDDVNAQIENQLNNIRTLISTTTLESHQSENRADDFLLDPTWNSTRQWFERMCQRIIPYQRVDEKWVKAATVIDDERPPVLSRPGSSTIVLSSKVKAGGTGSLRGGVTFA